MSHPKFTRKKQTRACTAPSLMKEYLSESVQISNAYFYSNKNSNPLKEKEKEIKLLFSSET